MIEAIVIEGQVVFVRQCDVCCKTIPEESEEKNSWVRLDIGRDICTDCLSKIEYSSQKE